MVQVTTEAARHLAQLRTDRGHGPDVGARFIRKDGKFGVTFSEQPVPGDKLVAKQELNVYVPADVADVLNDSVIDVKTQEGKARLIARPKAEAATAKATAPAKPV
jgi:Fe-S cluster assembly iron-binding protein IscA